MDVSNNRKDVFSIAADILDDLASRFIINLPDNDRTNFVRICFQIELAHWFYLDFYCNGDEHKSQARPCGIKQFAGHIFNHIPFLSAHVNNLDNILQEWKQYKMSVPTYGAILMSSDLKHVLLVQSYWSKSSWGFPKGKVNENEDPIHCAIREVYEETGYDIANLADADTFIEGVLNYQYTRLYLIRNIPLETVFVPRTRKEIKCCEWFAVEHLPTHKTDPVSRNHLALNANSFFMIMPFVKRVKKWINEQTKSGTPITVDDQFDTITVDNNQMRNGNGSQRRQRHKSVGDLDSSNVVTLNSSAAHSELNANGLPKLTNGKQKHFLQTEQADRSLSPIVSDYQLKPVRCHPHSIANRFMAQNSAFVQYRHLKTQVNGTLSAKSIVQQQLPPSPASQQQQQTSTTCIEYDKRKKGVIKTQSAGNIPSDRTTMNAPQWQRLFNPPKLSYLLGTDQNINKWQNISLNKDAIMIESMNTLNQKN